MPFMIIFQRCLSYQGCNMCFFSGEELIYLDPHTKQPIESFSQGVISDESYHCPYACRMNINDLDPSIALVSAVAWKCVQYQNYCQKKCCTKTRISSLIYIQHLKILRKIVCIYVWARTRRHNYKVIGTFNFFFFSKKKPTNEKYFV